MEIYTSADRERIKARMESEPAYLKRILESTKNVRRRLYIQKSGVGTWYHYFTCPICGVRLTFDYDNNERFTCPNCGNTVSGEPYLGAWWESVLGMTTSAAYKLAVAFVGTGDADLLATSRAILLGYADNYANYEVHGGIPYNKPGRFLSQVLSDCDPVCDLSRTYALIRDELTEEERTHVENDLLRPAAAHQMANLTPQLHNHEVAVCTSVAAVGLAVGDCALVRFATEHKYGLKYQLDHSYLSDGIWFEGSVGYHLYVLRWLMLYESMAKNTEHSLLRDARYAERIYDALLFPKNLYIGDHLTERLNDGSYSLLGNADAYELAYAHFGKAELLPLLAACYKDISERKVSLTALIYGVDSLPQDIPDIETHSYISEHGSHLALLHGSEERRLLLKALPYGGEHDHYDRLAISFDAFSTGACVDFGTASGYGSPLHYGYFKNTATHNTVCIAGENMPPCDTVVNEYRLSGDGSVYLDAETLPPEEYEMLDSFTIKQWNDEVYRGVRMRRIIAWYDSYFIDVFAVSSTNGYRKEWTLHIAAECNVPDGVEHIGRLAENGAQSYIENAAVKKGQGIVKCEYARGDLHLDVHTLADGLDLIYADGPDNPATRRVSYLLERSVAECPVYVNVIEAHKGDPLIATVSAELNGGTVTVTVTEKDGKTRTLTLDPRPKRG